MTETMEYSAGRCRFRAWADLWVVSFPESIDTGVTGITDQNCIRKYSHFASRLYASGLGGLDIYAEEHLRLMVNEDNSAILQSEQTLVARVHAHIVGSVWQLAASTPRSAGSTGSSASLATAVPARPDHQNKRDLKLAALVM
jgi:hypothetical protein